MVATVTEKVEVDPVRAEGLLIIWCAALERFPHLLSQVTQP